MTVAEAAEARGDATVTTLLCLLNSFVETESIFFLLASREHLERKY